MDARDRQCGVRWLAWAAAACAGWAAMVPSAEAQTNIAPVEKYAYQENCGWQNWRDAGSPTPGGQGARVGPAYLSGYVWGENIGWINLGDGTPTNGVAYANVNGTDFGVNRNTSTGALSGMAWGENVGWINFGGGALATPPSAARVDAANLRLRGYAWGENIGWVNLDDAMKHVKITCAADFNASGTVTIDDLFLYINAYFTGAPAADFNGVGGVTIDDLFLYFNAYFVGC